MESIVSKHFPLTGVDIFPISDNSREIYNLKQHGLIGVSPFNGYFNESILMKLISFSIKTFNKINIFVPDTLSVFTLMALGYTKKESEYKTQRQDRYLQNKVIRVLQKLGFDEYKAKEMIITFTCLSSNKDYRNIFNDCLNKFRDCQDFRAGCLSTSTWVLGNNLRTTILEDNRDVIAVEYFLRELPLFLDTPKILNVETSVFIYHKPPLYLEYLYLNNLIVSSKQGFLKINFNNIKNMES